MTARRVERIGDATLYLGDCREIAAGLTGIDAMITDPPYGINFSGKVTKHTDGRGRDDVYEDGASWAAETLRRITLMLSMFQRAAIFTGTRHMTDYPAPSDIGGVVCPNGGGRSAWGFGCLHPVAFYGKSPFMARGLGALPTVKVIYHPGLHITGESDNPHPCPKPEAFMLWLVGIASLENECVIDPFMGSGTTGVAALRLGRKFVGIEIEERWFDVACRRIEAEARQGRLAFDPEADAIGSYNDAVRACGERYKTGEPLGDFFKSGRGT